MNQMADQEWTLSEIEKARSLIAGLNNNNFSYANSSREKNKKHNVMDELHKLFRPSKTARQVMDLYIHLVMEMQPMQYQEEKSGGASGMDGLVNKNFGVPEEQEAAMDGKDFAFGFLLNQRGVMDMEEEVPVVEPNKVEVLENKMAFRQPVVAPQARRFWTKEEHRQFLRGLHVYGRGQWKSISKHFVPTRTPVQVSSHAQKYYKRLESKLAGNQMRYSINDVGLDDVDPWAPENRPGAWKPLAFAGGAARGVRYPSFGGLQAPTQALAPAIPFANMNVNNLAQFRSPFVRRASQRQPAWSGMQMSANSVAAPMAGPRNFVPVREGSSNMNNMY